MWCKDQASNEEDAQKCMNSATAEEKKNKVAAVKFRSFRFLSGGGLNATVTPFTGSEVQKFAGEIIKASSWKSGGGGSDTINTGNGKGGKKKAKKGGEQLKFREVSVDGAPIHHVQSV